MTSNLGDFPDQRLRPFHLEAVDPDRFLLDQLDLAPRVTIQTLWEQVGD